MRSVALLALLAACADPSVADDSFWSDTSPDDPAIDTVYSQNGSVAIAAGETKNAELIDSLPVARREQDAIRRVALRLRPSDLPSLAIGDRLIVPAEVQVTTRCDIGQVAPGCNYNPSVRAQLILTGNPDDTTARGPTSTSIAIEGQSCTKQSHHCMFVFRPSDASIVLDGNVPCVATNSCFINLVMWAWDPDARPGDVDKVLVGQNDGDYLDNGNVTGDVSRLMAIRERGITAADRGERESSGGGSVTVPTNTDPVVIFAHELAPNGLAKHEQFAIEVKLATDVSSRARFSTEIFVTRNPGDKSSDAFAAITPTAIDEGNGFNCTPEASPCTTRKVGVFRVDEDIAGPVYVNVVAISAVPGGGSAHVEVKRGDSWVRSVRYPARVFGR